MSDAKLSEEESETLTRLLLPWRHEPVPEFHHVPVDDIGFFATFWASESIESRTKTLLNDDSDYRGVPYHWFPSSGYNVLKGVQQFVDALFWTRKDPEIQRALWVQAHLHELEKDLPHAWRGDGFRLVVKARNAVSAFLRERNVEQRYHYKATTLPWHHLHVFGEPPKDVYYLGDMIHLHALAVIGRYRLVYGGRLEENVVWFPDDPQKPRDPA